MPAPPSILFLTPCFLSHRLHKDIRGVEVFDLHLTRQLVQLGCDVTVGAESSWKGRFAEHLAGAMPRVLWTPPLRKPLPNGLVAAALASGRTYDALILGNTTNGLVPAVKLLHAMKRFDRAVLIAHKITWPAFPAKIARLPIRVVAVNDQIRAYFEPALAGRAFTSYGIPNAEDFHPRATPRTGNTPCEFVILGKLDNPWKGASIAIDAFRALPSEVRAKCRLNLVSYADPPRIDEPNIVMHPWQPAAAIPELLRRMDVMLVPSTAQETFSQAMVQGMLTGLPVIASELPPLKEKLDTGGGFVCRSAADYTTAMEQLARDPALRERMGAIARQTAIQRYVWDTRAFVERFIAPGA